MIKNQAAIRVSATELKPGDKLYRGDVVEFVVPVDLGMLTGWARMGNIQKAAVLKFVGKPEAYMVIDRIHFNVVRISD
jgi:hypothetical protein